jgi:alanine racemase
LAGNIQAVRRALTPSSELVFVVKSDAYGHGMLPVARCAWEHGVRRFAIVHLEEAQKLRTALPEAEILMVGVLDPADVQAAAGLDLVPVIVSRRHAEALDRACASEGVSLRCHAKIDTGMGRLGYPWEDAAEALADAARLPALRLEGICSHFASADSGDRTFADMQVERFQGVIEACREEGVSVGFRHISNSSGLLCDPSWDFDGVRTGILLYGYGPREEGGREIAARPCLSWRTRVVQVRRVPAGFPVSYASTYVTSAATRLAVLPVGYADGFSRRLGNRAQVLVGGRRHPVVGRVTMNMTIADVGTDAQVSEGDTVSLLGRDGNESIWADEMAGWCDTISYEILTRIRTDDRRTVPE